MAALYGPGPDTSPGLNQSILRLARGGMPAVPPGSIPLVFAADAARGHLLAGASAPAGRRYILSERLVSMLARGR